ncbi:MAG: hypothetical protein EOO88_50080 [Pedobacter sp.]|nr:MAG: hypothetical protein EOO88_50080 [Pedobacter sp.]
MDKRIEQNVEQALNSFDGAQKASPAPYLETRINARLKQALQKSNFWQQAVAFLSKPAVVVVTLLFIFAVNFIVLSSGDTTKKNIASGTTNVNTDFAINVSSMYDIENMEP